MEVFFHQLQFPCKTGLGLAKDDVKKPFFRIFQKTPKRRSIPISTSIVIIAVNAVNLPSLFYGILHQHGFLILDTGAVVRKAALIPIFFR